MNSQPNPSVHTDPDQHNLLLIQTLYDHNPDFALYAQSINDLFYYYVQHCTEQVDGFFLSPTDVYHILEVVHTLQQLKAPQH